mmetsp:Transcript_45643/g.126320  ORF Transcript_45643/g.126320 Transcript_45643/m.126320 type:complete len:721 (+) Transcript_45643:950-3112(+)
MIKSNSSTKLDGPIYSRAQLANVRRVVIKAGTSVVCNPDGRFSLSRLAAIVEQIAELQLMGKECILVTSGAVGCGRRQLRKQALLGTTTRQQLTAASSSEDVASASGVFYNSACASAGQLGLMSLYDTLFSQCDISASQFLVTSYDFTDESRRAHLEYSLEQIIEHGMVPIINENDAVSGNQGYTKENVFSDNDALASIVASQMGAEVLLLLTDVDGLYDRPPSEPGAAIIPEYYRDVEDVSFRIGDKSAQGRGGMKAKVDSAMRALDVGVKAVVVASGHNLSVVRDVFSSKSTGTIFMDRPPTPTAAETAVSCASSSAAQAEAARSEARKLQTLTSEERSAVMQAVAQALRDNAAEIMHANALDLAAVKTNKVEAALVQRLKMTEAKIETLAAGIEQLAAMDEPIGKVLGRTELADGLNLTKVTVPIGVLLVVFESRPDSLPQIASLSLRSGNGLLLKGGREAEHSNAALHRIVVDAVHTASGGRVGRGIIGLVTSRNEVTELLQLDSLIDLVIPRGGKGLVHHVKQNTRIPVLSHADGICHLYIDSEADGAKAISIAVDSKTDYPAACNATETILLHEATMDSCAESVLRALRQASVKLKAGPRAIELGLLTAADAADSMAIEYGDLTCLVEVVSDMDAAITHIHEHGSSHTECIVTENPDTAEYFQQRVDAACVFHNASTRFADGFRFGLGAEVGISTGRIHARGPVGVDGEHEHEH